MCSWIRIAGENIYNVWFWDTPDEIGLWSINDLIDFIMKSTLLSGDEILLNTDTWVHLAELKESFSTYLSLKFKKLRFTCFHLARILWQILSLLIEMISRGMIYILVIPIKTWLFFSPRLSTSECSTDPHQQRAFKTFELWHWAFRRLWCHHQWALQKTGWWIPGVIWFFTYHDRDLTPRATHAVPHILSY